MKKVLTILLCLVLCFEGVSALAYFDYSDVSEEYVNVTDLLYELEIMEGFEDGTFRPDDTLTRAEATAIMVRLVGLEDDAVQGETAFCDVPETHWASGYVNVAHANGIIKGMGDGTFDPDGLVTYMQFVKMLVCLLGYEPVALANGDWVGGGYLLAGSKTGITKGVEGKFDKTITRMTAARLVYNSLEIEIFVQERYAAGIDGMTNCFPDYDDKKTILSEYLDCELIIGVVKCLDENEIEVTLDRNSKTYKEGEILVLENKCRTIDELDGKMVTAWIKKGEEKNVFLVGDTRKTVTK